jgi:hypothetical protein
MEESTDLRGRTPGGWLEAFGRAIKSGTVGGLSAAIVAMLARKREDGRLCSATERHKPYHLGR